MLVGRPPASPRLRFFGSLDVTYDLLFFNDLFLSFFGLAYFFIRHRHHHNMAIDTAALKAIHLLWWAFTEFYSQGVILFYSNQNDY